MNNSQNPNHTNQLPKEKRNNRKTLIGKVVSTKQQKTAVLLVESYVLHKVFKKRVRKTSRFQFHDENNETKLGDVVEVMETRPLSKTKRYRLVKIIKKNDSATQEVNN